MALNETSLSIPLSFHWLALTSSCWCLCVSLQNPNALDSKVLVDFDHVKNSLKIDGEGKLQP